MKNISEMREKTSKKIRKEPRRRIFAPYIGGLFHIIIAYIGGGILTIVLIAGATVTESILGIVFVLIIGGIVWWLTFFLPYFLPGVRILWDMTSDSFEKCKIQYQNSLILKYNCCSYKKILREGKVRREMEPFLDVCCRKKDGSYINLFSARYHGMVPGDIYTVTYGKHSKVLISILSADGEEVWNIPPNEWRTKSFSKIEVFDEK